MTLSLEHTAHPLSLLRALYRSRIDTNGDVSNHPLGDILAIHRLHRYDRVVSTIKSLRENRVDGVGSPVYFCVRDVGFQGHDLALECFVEVELTSANCIAMGYSAVSAERPVAVDLDVDVDGAFDVEAYSG